MSFVKPEFRTKWKTPILPWQEKGILSKHLWPKKNSIVRIIPGYDPQTGEIYRQNIKVNEYASDAQDLTEYLSNTFFLAKTVQGFGKNGMRFITDYPTGSPDEQRFAGNTAINIFGRTVYYTVDAVRKGKKAHCTPTPEWEAWVGKQATLSFDRVTLLFQALIFVCNDRYFENEAKQPYLLADGSPAPFLAVVGIDHNVSKMELEKALVEPMNPQLNLDAATNNKYGALAEMNGNILYFNSYIPPEAKYAALKPSVQAPGPGWNPQPYNLTPEVVQGLWTPWADLLHYMTAEEQIILLAKEFGADTVNYVLGLHPTFAGFEFPEIVRAAGLGKYAAFVDPNNVPEQFRYAQPQRAVAAQAPAGSVGVVRPVIPSGINGVQVQQPQAMVQPQVMAQPQVVQPQVVAQPQVVQPQGQMAPHLVPSAGNLGQVNVGQAAPAAAMPRPAAMPQPGATAQPATAGMRAPAAAPTVTPAGSPAIAAMRQPRSQPAGVPAAAPVDRARLAAEAARVRSAAAGGAGLPASQQTVVVVPEATVSLAQDLLTGEGVSEDDIPF